MASIDLTRMEVIHLRQVLKGQRAKLDIAAAGLEAARSAPATEAARREDAILRERWMTLSLLQKLRNLRQ